MQVWNYDIFTLFYIIIVISVSLCKEAREGEEVGKEEKGEGERREG